uniref:Kinetochore protein NDC80 n=1 Tax=Micromonas pusilla TaxID=38833 RepID=A0A6U2B990_MICPS|mmetsp:Transcript_11896/g.46074  ORF Transcript_11896/g.46074 Transcript_11896/m.46074 type:complete len:595 (+) Transcript_11896:137-1921(+)
MKDPVRSRSHLVALGASKRAPVNGHNQSVGNQLDDYSVGSGANGSVCTFNREIYGQRIDFGRDCNAHLFSGHIPRVDPRPVGEKAFTNLCARQLISYLSTHGFSSSLSPKAMTSPTTKEFASLVSFLFKVLDENFKSGSKFEEDITTVFKQLRYPFQISKSSLYAVGSAHTWPHLLAALIWLVHVYIYEDEVKKVEQSKGRDSNFLNHTYRAYAYFLAGDDAASTTLEREFVSAQTEISRDLANDIQALESDNSDLHHALTEMVRKDDETVPLEKDYLLREADVYDSSSNALRISIDNAESRHTHIITCILSNKTFIQDAAVATAHLRRSAFIHGSDGPTQSESNSGQGGTETLIFALKTKRTTIENLSHATNASIELEFTDWENGVSLLRDYAWNVQSASGVIGVPADSSSTSDHLHVPLEALETMDSDFFVSFRVAVNRVHDDKIQMQKNWCFERERLFAQNLQASQKNLQERMVLVNALDLNVCRHEHDYVAERDRIQSLLKVLMSNIAEIEEQIELQKRFPKNIVANVESILRHCQATCDLHAQRLRQEKLLTQNSMLAALDALMGHKQQVQDTFDVFHGKHHASSQSSN